MEEIGSVPLVHGGSTWMTHRVVRFKGQIYAVWSETEQQGCQLVLLQDDLLRYENGVYVYGGVVNPSQSLIVPNAE